MTIRISTSITFCFRELPLAERFAAAREVGVDGVELQSLEGHDPAPLAEAACAAGMPVALLNVELGDLMSGGPGLSCVPGREEAFLKAVNDALDAADLLDAQAVHLGPGRALDFATRDRCLATYKANVRAAVALAEGRRPLLIEAMNTKEIPDVIPSGLAEAAAVIEDDLTGLVGLQFDLYHAALNGEDIPAALAAQAHLIRHIQFSDVPGRHQPGTGSIDFPRALQAIKAMGYQGWIGAEYMPEGPSAASFGWLSPFREALA